MQQIKQIFTYNAGSVNKNTLLLKAKQSIYLYTHSLGYAIQQ